MLLTTGSRELTPGVSPNVFGQQRRHVVGMGGELEPQVILEYREELCGR